MGICQFCTYMWATDTMELSLDCVIVQVLVSRHSRNISRARAGHCRSGGQTLPAPPKTPCPTRPKPLSPQRLWEKTLSIAFRDRFLLIALNTLHASSVTFRRRCFSLDVSEVWRIQMITGTAIAILPISAFFCMIFLMRLWQETSLRAAFRCTGEPPPYSTKATTTSKDK